jgi:3-hydroxyisobutyrate dehydrogenase
VRLGWVGLGEIGRPLCGRLVAAGHEVLCFDRDPSRTVEGAVRAASLEAVAGEVVFTCLPNPAASETVLAGLLPHLDAGAVWVECSTLGPQEIRRLAAMAAERGVATIECPVTGGVHLAARGEITLLAGGEAALLARHRPLLRALGRRYFEMGPLGSAATIKVITNMLAFIHLVADGEALMLAARAGLDLRTSWEAITASSGTSFVHETEGQLILSGSYDIGFSMDLALKDLGFALGIAEATGTPLRLAALTRAIFEEGRAAYGGTAQSTSITRLLEDALGTPLRAEGFPARLS